MYNESDFLEYISNDSSLKWYQLEPNDAKELIIKLVLFVICPFAAFLGSLLRPTSKSSFVIYFLFGVLFCWHMDPAGLTGYDDYIGIRDLFLHHKYNMSEFFDMFMGYITFQGKEKEVYTIFLNAMTRVFSNNYHLFFALAGIPYLVFSLLSVRKLTSDVMFPVYGIIPLVIILLFVIPRDIVTVQNPRYTTGVWISIWGFLNFFDEAKQNRRLYIIPILLTPLIHSGFWPMMIVFLVFLFCPIQIRALEILFFASIPFSLLSYDLFSGLNYSFLPPVFSHWIESYLSDDAYAKLIMHKGSSGFFWVRVMFSYIIYALYIYIAVLLMKNKQVIFSQKETSSLYPFYLLLFAVTNFIRLLPTIGERYLYTIEILTVYLFFKVFYPFKKIIFFFLLGGWSFYIFMRWFYSGAGLLLVPKNIYYDNLFSLITDYIQ